MKIGITTFYYKVYNYGANLQAYALAKTLQKMGYEAEQICFNTSDGFPEYKLPFPQNCIIRFKEIVANILWHIIHCKYYWLHSRRQRACERFLDKQVAHSKQVYKLHNIAQSQKEYDIFITGSDVVWSPVTNSPIFFFRFLDKATPKFAYAASLGTNKLSDKEKERFKQDLESFSDISIREKSVVPIVSEACGRDVKHCIDSTLLLDEHDWNEVCSPRILDKPYVFTYFLGDNEEAKELAIKYAKSHDLDLVNIPYYWPHYTKFLDFGDVKLSNVSAAEFLSLIKYANCIFTDSFHACVFSEIFGKQFFAVKRSANDNLSVRLIDFLKDSGTLDHYCDNTDKLALDYIENICVPNYNQVYDLLTKLRAPSIEFLKTNIEKVVDQYIK